MSFYGFGRMTPGARPSGGVYHAATPVSAPLTSWGQTFFGGQGGTPASIPIAAPTNVEGALAAPAAKPLITIGPQSDALAKALLARGATGEIRTPFEALGKLAQLGVGGWKEDQYQNAQLAQEQAPGKELSTALAGLVPGSPNYEEKLGQALMDVGGRYGKTDWVLKGAELRAPKTAAGVKVEDFYTKDGRKIKGVYDPTAPDGFRPIGGPEAAPAAPAPLTEIGKIHEAVKRGEMSPTEGDLALQALSAKSQKEGSLIVSKGAQIQTPDGQWITPPAISDSNPGLFDTRSIAGQGLNFLIKTGKLTEEQAANVAAGKVITTPTGEMIFVTPQGIFSKADQQAPAVPVAPPADGSAPPVPAGTPAAPGDAGKIPLTGQKNFGTEEQTKAGGFADRAAGAADTIDKVGLAGTSLQNRMAARLPLGLGNYLEPNEYQLLDQAERNFVNAVLRRESGAAISQSEFDNARQQYFPQPGDTPDKIAAKKLNREQTILSLQSAAGPNYPHQVLKPPAAAAAEKPPVDGAQKAPDGNWYVPDPNRPGKYLQVMP